MEKVKQFFDMDFKKAWIFSIIIFAVYILVLKFSNFLDFSKTNIILSFTESFLIAGCALLLLKKLELKKIWLIILSVLSIVLGTFFPLGSFLPLVTLTAVTSGKKSNIPMWIVGIILIIISSATWPLFVLLLVFSTDTPVNGGIAGFIFSIIVYYVIHKPLITLYTVLLGNKKSYWYYLILLPEILIVTGFLIYSFVFSNIIAVK